MAWREPDAYDDWDYIAAALYEAILVRSLRAAREWKSFADIAKFDMRTKDYSEYSFIADLNAPRATAFICFETSKTPFDTCLFSRLDASGCVFDFERRPLADVQFIFVGRSATTLTSISAVEVEL
jgi:hypothetical protein